MNKLPEKPNGVRNEVNRELAQRALRKLGNVVGYRERTILEDRNVIARRSGDYPGCWVFIGNGGQMIYRQSDNTIVG